MLLWIAGVFESAGVGVCGDDCCFVPMSVGWTGGRIGRKAGLGGNLPEKVPLEVIKKARSGRVNWRKAGYLVLAAQTPKPPAARPIRPPPMPPLTVALRAH